jgi:outer membrane protein TolC
MNARALMALLGVLVLASPAQAEVYTLSKLVEKVTNDFPTVVAGREGVEAARASLKASQFAWLPTGDLTLFMTGSPKVKCIGKPVDPNDPSANIPDPRQDVRESNCLRTTVVDLARNASLADVAPIHGLYLRLDVRLDQPLYSFGKMEAGISLSKAGVVAAQANLEREQADAVWNATRAYWGLKAARAAVDTITEGMDKVKEWIEKMDEALSGKNPSRYTESDLARLRVALINAQLLLLDQVRNRDYAMQALQLLTNDPEADVDDSELELMDAEAPEPLTGWQARALRMRSEFKSQASTVSTVRAIRKLRIAEFLPDLLFSSTLGVGYANAMDTPQNYYMGRPNYVTAQFGLVLRQPLDFGLRAARYLQAKHDERAAVARSDAATITYSTEVARAYADYEEARGRVRETARGEKLSRGWYNSVDQNVSTGLFTDGREMVEAVQNYFTFRLRNFQALFDANIALGWLRRTTGTATK